MYCGEYRNGLWISVDILKHCFREQEIKRPTIESLPLLSGHQENTLQFCALSPTCCGKASELLDAE